MTDQGKHAAMPRVAIVGTRGYPSYYGGFETAVRKLAPHLAERGWKVVVYSRPNQTRVEDPDFDPRVQSVVTRGIESTALSTLSFGLTSTLHAVFRSRPDVAVVMNVANGYWLPIFRLRGIPTVVNVDGIEWHRAKWSRLGKTVFKVGAWLTARFATEIVVDAHAIGAYWNSRLGRNGTYIPYGGDPLPACLPEPKFAPGSYVLVVARFVPENSIAAFLDAVPAITRQMDVVLVGSAPEGSPLWEQATEVSAASDRVHWLGHVADDQLLASLWHNSAVYFHGHSVGGTNPALVQAMAFGATIVARDTEFNREVLADTATYCQPEPKLIADAVLHASQAVEGLGDAAKERASTHFSWLSVCEKYETTIRAVLKKNAATTR